MARVLHLFNVFGALTERTIWENALSLAEAGQIHIGYETLAAEAPPLMLPATQLGRVHVESVDDVDEQMDRLAADVRDPAMRELLAAHDSGRQRFDLLHGHFGPRILQGAPWLMRGVPMVVSIYGYDAARLLRDPAWASRYRWAAGRGAVFVALAQSMRSRLEELGIAQKPLRLIHLGIDLAHHVFAPRPAPATPRFVFVGRFVEKKGAADLVGAAQILLQRQMSFTIDLIGGGPLEQSLRAQVSSLGLQNHIQFIGTVPFNSLFDHLADATALVQPSVTASDGDAEGAPMVLMHAQALGIPCITTRHSGNAEVLPPQAQRFVVGEHDTGGIADAMLAMSELPLVGRSSLQQAGRRWIEEHYDRTKTVRDYLALYQELIG